MAHYETIFNDSLGRILDRNGGDAFFKGFYECFISSSTEVKQKFANTDMDNQRRMLKSSFYHMLTFFVTKETEKNIVEIARKHNMHHRDIHPELYDLWLECLIRTVKRHDSKFSDEVELAWRLVMANGITYMKFKYNH